jgi:hypothetical protein
LENFSAQCARRDHKNAWPQKGQASRSKNPTDSDILNPAFQAAAAKRLLEHRWESLHRGMTNQAAGIIM